MTHFIGHTPGGYTPLSDWELLELVDRLAEARNLPIGFRQHRMRMLSAEYGVSTRTLYRWAGKTIAPVKVGPYRALFAWKKGARPYQVTPWDRAA